MLMGQKCVHFHFILFFYFLTTRVSLLITHHSYNSTLNRPILALDINEVDILKIYILMKDFRKLILSMAMVLI